MSSNAIAAEILEASARGFAREAAMRLQAALAQSEDPLAESASQWQAHLYQRVIELAAAIRIEQPGLFHKKMIWLRQAYAARGVSADVPKAIIDSLRQTIGEDLPAESAAAVTKILDDALGAMDAPQIPVETSLDPRSPNGALALRFIASCMDGMPDEAVTMILQAIDQGLTPQSAITDVLMPAEREIGNLWHGNEASIAQEHLVTNTTTELLAVIGQRFAGTRQDERTAITASVAGNAHDMGIRAAAVLLRLAGWRTVFLGSDLPPDEIAASADHFGADIAIVSATIATQVDAISATVESLRHCERRPGIIVAGGVFEAAPELWKDVGADALCPDIDATVHLANTLLEQVIGRRG